MIRFSPSLLHIASFFKIVSDLIDFAVVFTLS